MEIGLDWMHNCASLRRLIKREMRGSMVVVVVDFHLRPPGPPPHRCAPGLVRLILGIRTVLKITNIGCTTAAAPGERPIERCAQLNMGTLVVVAGRIPDLPGVGR